MIETVLCPGVERRSWLKKLNPIWWFGNDEDPAPTDWYMPSKPTWLRYMMWYIRNPLRNFSNYVVGVTDRPHYVTGPQPAMANLWTDIDPTHFGWKWSVSSTKFLRLPFCSFENAYVIFYAGWQPYGFFGFKLNLKTSYKGIV
jgi:hypothetical protein